MGMNNDTQVKSIKELMNGQIFKFILVGLGCATVEFLVFSILYSFYDIDYLISNVISVLVAIFINYFLSRKYVFQKSKYSISIEVVSFIVFSVAAILLNHMMLLFLVEKLDIQYVELCKAATIITVAVFNFVTKKYIVFRK